MKKKGITGTAISIVTFLIVGGLLVALLAMFNWDIMAVFSWIGTSVWNIIRSIGDWFLSMPLFRSIFS